jgi:hypothetical protein
MLICGPRHCVHDLSSVEYSDQRLVSQFCRDQYVDWRLGKRPVV